MNISINASQSAATQSYNISGVSEKEQETKVQKEEEQQSSSKSSSVQYTATSSQGDTLEISEEAQVASTTSTSTSSTTSDLSSYSETQLKEMYNNGEITLAEYQEALSELEEE